MAAPDPAAKVQHFQVTYDGKLYEVKFYGDKARELRVRIEGSRYRLGSWRSLWDGYGYGAKPQSSRVAQIIGFVLDAERAAKAGAEVEDEEMRAQRHEREKREYLEGEANRQAQQAAAKIEAARRERLFKAAPALLAALRQMVHVHSNATYGSLAERTEAHDAAVAAILQAEGTDDPAP